MAASIRAAVAGGFLVALALLTPCVNRSQADEFAGAVETIVRDYLDKHPDQVERIVKDYLVKHPEAVQAALAELLKKRPTTRNNPSLDKAAIVKSNAPALFGSAH